MFFLRAENAGGTTRMGHRAASHLLVLDGPGPFIFDTIEIAASNMVSGET
jgi:hypothetical protein